MTRQGLVMKRLENRGDDLDAPTPSFVYFLISKVSNVLYPKETTIPFSHPVPLPPPALVKSHELCNSEENV